MKIIRKKACFPGLRRDWRSRGFSLIEVTISIAITAVALVSLMGMLPAGMRTMREAGDRAVETRIHQQILGEIQLTAWATRAQYDSGISGVWFFDDQGIRIHKSGTQADPNFDFSHVYSARVSVPGMGNQLPQSIGGASYTGVVVPGKPLPDPNLQLVIVEITSVIDSALESPGGFDQSGFLNSIRSFQVTITKMN